jgi:hypothetical protein
LLERGILVLVSTGSALRFLFWRIGVVLGAQDYVLMYL